MSYYSHNLKLKEKLIKISEIPKFYQMYVSHPQVLGASSASVKTEDAVPELVIQYLNKYNSPMAETASDFVNIFRSYHINPIIPLAIAQCESNLGKKMPPDCNNPFGWGIHSKGTLCFETWQEGYEKVALGIKEKYIDKGLISPDELMTKYNRTSLEEREGSWAKCVNKMVDEIESLKIRKY